MSKVIEQFKEVLRHKGWAYGDNWEVYQFHYIDWFELMPYANEVLTTSQEDILLMAKVVERFKSSGWEGDGEIQIGWIPTFMVDKDDTFGSLFWHVKQSNNGTSFILVNPKEITMRRPNLTSQWHKNEWIMSGKHKP